MTAKGKKLLHVFCLINIWLASSHPQTEMVALHPCSKLRSRAQLSSHLQPHSARSSVRKAAALPMQRILAVKEKAGVKKTIDVKVS